MARVGLGVDDYRQGREQQAYTTFEKAVRDDARCTTPRHLHHGEVDVSLCAASVVAHGLFERRVSLLLTALSVVVYPESDARSAELRIEAQGLIVLLDRVRALAAAVERQSRHVDGFCETTVLGLIGTIELLRDRRAGRFVPARLLRGVEGSRSFLPAGLGFFGHSLTSRRLGRGRAAAACARLCRRGLVSGRGGGVRCRAAAAHRKRQETGERRKAEARARADGFRLHGVLLRNAIERENHLATPYSSSSRRPS